MVAPPGEIRTFNADLLEAFMYQNLVQANHEVSQLRCMGVQIMQFITVF